MASIAELLARGGDLPEGQRDAEVLLCHCLQKNRSYLYTWPEREVEEGVAKNFLQLVDRRRRGTPIAYLTGHREFWSLDLLVNSETLIPRADTETLVARVLALGLPENAQVVDMGTGSGAIALALGRERPYWRITAVDISLPALEVARQNAHRLGIKNARFKLSDWYAALATRRFHLIVCNPPYIAGTDAHLDRGDLRFEPRGALVANDNGLADIARLVEGAPAHLHDGGWFYTEHGCEQGVEVRSLFQAAGFSEVATTADLAGLDRVTGGCLNCS